MLPMEIQKNINWHMSSLGAQGFPKTILNYVGSDTGWALDQWVTSGIFSPLKALGVFTDNWENILTWWVLSKFSIRTNVILEASFHSFFLIINGIMKIKPAKISKTKSAKTLIISVLFCYTAYMFFFNSVIYDSGTEKVKSFWITFNNN